MLKTIRIATILTGISAFAIPALAQTDTTIVPGDEALIQENEAQTRENVAEGFAGETTERAGGVDTRDTANTIVPGNESQMELNASETRTEVAEGFKGETTGDTAGEGDNVLVPGSGATFSPDVAPNDQNRALQDESVEAQQ